MNNYNGDEAQAFKPKPPTSIEFTTPVGYCINCFKKEIYKTAYFIISGNSLCEKHAKEAIDYIKGEER